LSSSNESNLYDDNVKIVNNGMKNQSSFSISSLKIHHSCDFLIERKEIKHLNNKLALSINSNLNNITEEEDFYKLKSKLSYFEDEF